MYLKISTVICLRNMIFSQTRNIAKNRVIHRFFGLIAGRVKNRGETRLNWVNGQPNLTCDIPSTASSRECRECCVSHRCQANMCRAPLSMNMVKDFIKNIYCSIVFSCSIVLLFAVFTLSLHMKHLKLKLSSFLFSYFLRKS